MGFIDVRISIFITLWLSYGKACSHVSKKVIQPTFTVEITDGWGCSTPTIPASFAPVHLIVVLQSSYRQNLSFCTCCVSGDWHTRGNVTRTRISPAILENIPVKVVTYVPSDLLFLQMSANFFCSGSCQAISCTLKRGW